MEEITLEKIDIIRERTGIGYAQAKEVLEKNNGNVVDTLIYIEKNQKSFGQNVNEISNELIDTVKDIIKKGNVNRIKIKKDNKVLIDIPVTAGIAAGAIGIWYTPLLAIGAVAAVISKITIEVEREDGKVEVINDLFKKKNENNETADVNNKENETDNSNIGNAEEAFKSDEPETVFKDKEDNQDM